MTTPNHTPGPWRIIDSRDQGKATVVGSDFPAMGFVADVNLCRNNTHQQVDGRANAALIAAAPAMYEALNALVEVFPSVVKMTPYGVTMDISKIHDDAKAALAQAEGTL